MKTCTKCHIEKDESEFYKRTASKDGLRPSCKVCASIYGKNHLKNNKAKHDTWRKNWRENNREKYLAMQRKAFKKHFLKDKDHVRGINRKSRNKRRDKHIIETKKWRKKNRNHIKAYDAKYQAENGFPRKRQLKEWKEKNKEIIVRKRKNDIEKMNDNYIKARLRADGFKNNNIGEDLIEIKRTLLKIKRYAKEKKKTVNQ